MRLTKHLADLATVRATAGQWARAVCHLVRRPVQYVWQCFGCLRLRDAQAGGCECGETGAGRVPVRHVQPTASVPPAAPASRVAIAAEVAAIHDPQSELIASLLAADSEPRPVAGRFEVLA